MTRQKRTRLVLARNTDRDAVHSAALNAGLQLVDEVPANHPQPYELIYTAPQEGVSLHIRKTR